MIENLTSHRTLAYDIDQNQRAEISYVHSLYGGLQIEVFQPTSQNELRLEKIKFENYAALMYYFSGDVKNEYYEEPFWIMGSEYKTKHIRFILPLIQENFCNYMLKVNEQVIKADEIGCPGDIISIYLMKKSAFIN